MATAPLALFASPSLACRRAMPATGLTAAVRTPLVSSQTMQLFARDLAGATLSVELDAGVSCAEACDALCAKAGVPSAEVRLVLEGKQLDLDLPLADYSVEAGSTLHMLPRMCGGVIEPSLIVLARKYNQDKKVCRICYARLPPRAINCRKKQCGHTNQLRVKKKLK